MATSCEMTTDRCDLTMSSTLEEFLNTLKINLCEERCSEIYAQMLVCTIFGDYPNPIANVRLLVGSRTGPPQTDLRQKLAFALLEL